MEIIDPKQKREYEQRATGHAGMQPDNRGRIMAGLFVVLVGGLMLINKMNIYFFPNWLFSWPMLLIAIGVFVGARNNFQTGGWIIPIIFGTVFLIDRFIPEMNLRPFIFPILIMIIGAFIMLSPGKGRRRRIWHRKNFQAGPGVASDDLIESVSVFGGIRRNIISKNFQGGEAVTIFGGSEINLMQADFNGTITLEVVQIFGGTKLLIPANWNVVSSELVSILGDIQDTRVTSMETIDTFKTLIVKGVSILGGITVKNY